AAADRGTAALDAELAPARLPERTRDALCARLELLGRGEQHAQHRDLLRSLVEQRTQGPVERRERQLVDAQRARQRIASHALEQVPAPQRDARLRSAEQLVAAEDDQVRTLLESGLDQAFRNPVRAQIDEGAAAAVLDEWQAPSLRDRREPRE